MTIEFKTGNILDFTETIMTQQVNHQKVMGGGLALQIKNKYPKIFDEYCKFIDEHSWNEIKEKILIHVFKISDKQSIMNIFGQRYYGRDKCYTDYDMLKNSFEVILDACKKSNREESIAIPYRIGSGLSGGSWEVVYKIIQDIFENSKIKVVIYQLEGVE